MTDYSNKSKVADLEDERTSGLTFVLITPARNEAAFIGQTIKAVVEQKARPAKWVIVSDGSTDGTDEIARKYMADYPWIELVRMPERAERHFAGKVHAFNAGYARVNGLKYDVVGNLDADITFDEEYFHFLMRKFEENPQLGVAGTPFRQESHQYDYRFTSIEHVSGACQLFRRECFEEIGGYQPIKIGGIDLVAVLTARMKGWQTRTFLDKTSVHHRKMGTGRSPWIIYFKAGQGDYMLGTHPVWEFVRSLYQMSRQPRVVAGCSRLAGFLWAMLKRPKMLIPPELAQFRRTEQLQRLRSFFRTTRHALSKLVQKVFWIYRTNNFYITSESDFMIPEPAVKCTLVPITLDNYFRVREFRDDVPVSEFRKKLIRDQIGFFAEVEGRMIGSNWATINNTEKPTVVNMYMRLMPHEAHFHDLVIDERCRGMRVGPFLMSKMISMFLNDYRVSRITGDVSLKNARMSHSVRKTGLPFSQQVLSVSVFGRLLMSRVLKQYE